MFFKKKTHFSHNMEQFVQIVAQTTHKMSKMKCNKMFKSETPPTKPYIKN